MEIDGVDDELEVAEIFEKRYGVSIYTGRCNYLGCFSCAYNGMCIKTNSKAQAILYKLKLGYYERDNF